MTKPEPEWMPHNGEINKERMRDTELFSSYTPQFRLRSLIRRTAVKAQIAAYTEAINQYTSWDERDHALTDLINALRAELAEMERGDAT